MSNPSPHHGSPRNRRLSARRVGKRAARVECRKGTLGLGKSIGVGFVDLSETGIRLLVSEQMARAEEVEVILSSLGGREFKIFGQVMWCTRGIVEGIYCIGVRFDKRVPYSTLMELTRLPESK